jgi:hypothetical protein
MNRPEEDRYLTQVGRVRLRFAYGRPVAAGPVCRDSFSSPMGECRKRLTFRASAPVIGGLGLASGDLGEEDALGVRPPVSGHGDTRPEGGASF